MYCDYACIKIGHLPASCCCGPRDTRVAALGAPCNLCCTLLLLLLLLAAGLSLMLRPCSSRRHKRDGLSPFFISMLPPLAVSTQEVEAQYKPGSIKAVMVQTLKAVPEGLTLQGGPGLSVLQFWGCV